MTDPSPPSLRALPVADHDLARRVLRWLATGGIVLGCAQLVFGGAWASAWRLGFLPAGWPVVLKLLCRVAMTVTVVAPAILVAGSIGLLRDRLWARNLLIAYAFLQVSAALANLGFTVSLQSNYLPGQNWTIVQRIFFLLGGIQGVVLHSIYPAAVIVCLLRPGLMTFALPAASTFQVLPPAAVPGPAMPLQPFQP